MTRPVVETVRRGGARPVEPPSAPLPAAVLTALAAIAGDLRHIPRDCVVDRAELLHWLRRVANRVDRVATLRVTTPLRRPVAAMARPAAAPRALSAREQAEAVFGRGPAAARLGPSRTVLSRKGRAVMVEVRRATGQMELGL